MNYPFTEAESKAAAAEWGANCGPNALAFALGVKLDVVRPAIPGFEAKRYTSPTMMKAALVALGRTVGRDTRPEPKTPAMWSDMFPCGDGNEMPCLVRVQWTGTWTAAGSNPRWAYGYTHWICTWWQNVRPMMFDVNGGVRLVTSWIQEIVPLLATHPKGDGGWYPTHVWELAPAGTPLPVIKAKAPELGPHDRRVGQERLWAPAGTVRT